GLVEEALGALAHVFDGVRDGVTGLLEEGLVLLRLSLLGRRVLRRLGGGLILGRHFRGGGVDLIERGGGVVRRLLARVLVVQLFSHVIGLNVPATPRCGSRGGGSGGLVGDESPAWRRLGRAPRGLRYEVGLEWYAVRAAEGPRRADRSRTRASTRSTWSSMERRVVSRVTASSACWSGATARSESRASRVARSSATASSEVSSPRPASSRWRRSAR